ncbi:MAG TPA: hypothetical protein VHY37_04250 [Tepidisphaeraceae bacterium]|jgi:DNA repair exonuclease SbcCD ATPase subunit|nr:hypothetical protein [Tepidisphaeraceae bacterium]
MTADALATPTTARRLFDRLEGRREAIQKSHDELDRQRREVAEYLAVADEIKAALEKFSEQLFSELVEALQSQLTKALQDVLDQPIELKVERGSLKGAVTLGFFVERAGEREDIMKGQGGSVVNILSVGLRLLALHGQDDKRHRRFLILDEQDCWLRPDLVPKLVGIIHQAGKEMGFQVLMISHHESAMFEKYADRIYRCRPHSDGKEGYVVVEEEPRRREDPGD